MMSARLASGWVHHGVSRRCKPTQPHWSPLSSTPDVKSITPKDFLPSYDAHDVYGLLARALTAHRALPSLRKNASCRSVWS